MLSKPSEQLLVFHYKDSPFHLLSCITRRLWYSYLYEKKVLLSPFIDP